METNEGKRHHSSKSSRSVTPDPPTPNTPSSVESFRPIPRTPPPPTRVGPPPSPPVPTHPIAPVAPEPSGPVRLIPCAVCGRTFLPESLAKHVKICEKTTVKKRKTFDSSRQRREGTDLEQYLPKNFGLPENSPFLEKSPPNTAKATPKPKPQSTRTTIMKPAADLQKCPHCSRAFGMRAFERHVEWCADKAKILPAAPVQPPHVTDAKQRLNARTQYKAPLARGRRSSQSRDKSSQSRSASVESSRGVSPPPPRDCGDRRRRARASESMSSNDCNDEPSPHVPVIRNPRNSQNKSSGDANVKARQARLARDLSSSRNSKEPNLPNIQQEIADPNPKKPQDKIKQPRNIKKEQQLKKLEEIANKYNERQAKVAEEKEEEKKKRKEKRQIPVLKRVVNKNVKPKDEIAEPIEKLESSKVAQKTVRKPNAKAKPTVFKSTEITQQDRNKEKNTKNKTRRDTVSLPKENSMSVDSLDDCVTINSAGKTKFCQTVGINTELFCVPCVIHENVDVKPQSCHNKNRISLVESARKAKDNITDNTVELLYKNSTIDSSYNTQATTSSTTTTINQSDNYTPEISNDTYEVEKDKVDESDNQFSTNFLSKSEPIDSFKVLEDDDNGKGMLDLSGDHFEDSFEHDTSRDNLDNSDETKYEEENSAENNQSGRRHGSGDTYTKFTENPEDLDEFMHLTDEMINSQNQMELDLAKHVDNLHTPRTVSLETLNDKNLDNADDTAKKKQFSDTFEDLKLDLKQLLQRAGDTVRNSAKQTDRQFDKTENQDVSDMEHITVYGLKHYEQQQNKRISSDDEDSTIILPSITVTNKPEPKITCTRKRMQKIFKSNRKHILLREQSRGNADNRTFIVAENVRDSDDQSISTEAPPLKLPRIESARLDDGYDPFVSAARQMKELLSSDTDTPKKMLNSSKDLTRTLPILRPARDKAPLSQLRTENSKMIKDTLNKTYQKTPTLQRMKSFGSTNNDNNTNTSSFGGRCSSFRLNRNNIKPSQKLNTTFTKSSKENISMTDKTNFNRNSSLNRSFSSYTTSNYSTPKPKDKIPKIATSMYHSFTRTTIKQPVKLDKIKRDEEEKKNFVNLDAILADDNSSMTDSNYIDPRLINENDNLPINVNTILNNPDIISSMESLLTTENLPSKFDSFSKTHIPNYELNGNIDSQIKAEKDKVNNNTDTNKLVAAPVDNLSAQYDKIMSSLEESIASKTLARDEESVFEEFDLEEFMTTFDEEIHKRKSENKRTCSSTTRVVKQSELNGSNRTSTFSSVSSTPRHVNPNSNGLSLTPVTNKPFNFSSNNIVSENLFPSSVKRSTSLLDSIHKKVSKTESGNTRHKSDQLEQDIMQSLKEFDKLYESEKNQINQSNRGIINYNAQVHNGTEKESRSKTQRKSGKSDSNSNGNYTPNGKSSNDSAYSSLNRISPSKLTVCQKELNGPSSLERIPAGSDSSGSAKDEIRSVSSEEFLAMERSAELDEPIPQPEHAPFKQVENQVHEKRVSSLGSSRRGSWRPRADLSSSSSEASLHKAPQRLSRFCHECGSRFPVDTAKFCIECGVKRLAV